MNIPKRDSGRLYIHEDCQPAKKPKIVKPKIRKPALPYVGLGRFESEHGHIPHRYYYDWLRKSRYDHGRPFYFQHEPLYFGQQPNPSVTYLDNFHDRRLAPVYHVNQSTSAYLQPADPNCKTKIFNPAVNGGYMRSTGSNRISDRKPNEDDICINSVLPNFQAEFIDRKGFYETRQEMRQKSLIMQNNRNKRHTIEAKCREPNGRQNEEHCKKCESKEESLGSVQKIDRERQLPHVSSSTESQLKTATRENDEILEKRVSESNARGEKKWRKEKKQRRKAFTVASNLMERINEITEEKQQVASKEGNEPEREKKFSETRNGENVACRVFGLLSLQGSRERRYEITVEELKRRVSAPEHLNKVDMISYLRLAKNSARLLLEKYDIISSLHHRLSKHTILSKVSERECDDLAAGIHDINTSFFPFRAMAQQSVGRIKEMETNGLKEIECLKKRYQDLETTRSVLLEMSGTLESMGSTKEINDFKNLTHTFGIQNIANHAQFFDRYLKEEEQLILETLQNK